MDPENLDQPIGVQAQESDIDCSLNNNTLKDLVKSSPVKSPNTNKTDMEIDNAKHNSSNDQNEKENGVHSECNNIKAVDAVSDEINNGDINETNHNENDIEKSNVEDECNDKTGESEVFGKSLNSPNVNEHNKVNKISENDATPMDVDAPNTLPCKSLAPISVKSEPSDNVRPIDKESNDSPELIVSDGAAYASSPKSEVVSTQSTANKDRSSSEVTEANKESKAKEQLDSSSEVKTENENKVESESKTESSKKEESVKKKKSKTCEECGVKKGLKFQVHFKGKTRFLCSDTCFQNFKMKMQGKSAPANEPASTATVDEPSSEKCANCQKEIPSEQGYYPIVGDVKPLCSEDCLKKYNVENIPTKSCSQCKKVLENGGNSDVLTWETMVFCNEDCLGKYQSFLGSHCTCCQSPVPQSSLGKYSVCFGADIRQFCSCSCLDDFKKNLKVCSFCQTDLSSSVDSFLAPVGDMSQFKDFCSHNCMQRYIVMNNITKSAPQNQVCLNCKKQGTFKIQVKHNEQSYSLCSDLCVAGFRCSMKIKLKMCDTCYDFFSPDSEKEFSFTYDGQHKQFCSKACITLFVLSHRKIVACVSCKVKKYNFDMIEKVDANNQTQIFCSLNCLSLYRVSVNATSAKSIKCDFCSKNLPAQYHLTMSDGSIRNFCNYNCVMLFQNQYTNVCTLTTSSATRQSTPSPIAPKTTPATATPVISNVISLAPAGTRATSPAILRNVVPSKFANTVRQTVPAVNVISIKPPASSTVSSPSIGTVTNTSGQQVIREVIVKPPAPKSQKNKSVACKPVMQNKGINVKPQPCHKAVQTDDSPRPILLPIPVPIYIPTPLHMFSRPVPCPVPFPVPIPVPIIVPSSKESSTQDRISANPYEVDMRIAERVAQAGHKQKGSHSDDPNYKDGDFYSRETKFLSAYDAPSTSGAADDHNVANDLEDEYVFKDNRAHGKRGLSMSRPQAYKRSKTEEMANDIPPHSDVAGANQNSGQNDHSEPVPCLKHMFGVNAWKQWVLQKNEQMERGSQSSRKFKLFKTDLLLLPPDELNYSLSLFVKEVRKPNGEEYGAGSIYYLCLGIQKYLYQNGRIDNIFSDPYYEKFTECLNDILQSQDTLSTIEGYPSSRIEEEILWESKQLGAHSPHALLNTLMYFNTKYFKLKTVEDHSRLSFTHITKHWKKVDHTSFEKVALLRYYPPNKDIPRRDKNENPFYEQIESSDSLRCPVKLYEFYLSKCPESAKNRNDYYLQPERSCVPDSPVWYSAQPLPQEVISKMLQRIKVVREIYDI